ncbi:leucine-rich repeat-containing protein 42 isoform X1 [Tachysurus vachellii]|uniref:leucine-rich repeat-containing protein 42 isoform X1 n=1 Tax=Tachysurus vachellii TaxID=175792 RepID=UPI00296B4B8F|nr:leucine-rich repeat-containing protein 42 isoform X1 [Tachysurus vachellii]
MYSSGSNECECGDVFVREKGELRRVKPTGNVPHDPGLHKSSYKLFHKDFSVTICMDSFLANECRKRNDHFIFTYNGEGSLRYTVKSLLDISLLYIADNIEHVESLIGFPEQMADKLFTAAEEKQKFTEPSTSARGLQVFSQAYGELVLKSLCLRERCLLLSERMEEIRVFHCLETLDLHGCRLGDSHDFFSHLASEACSRLATLFLGANCLSDKGLQRLTAPIRVMKRGLENLQQLDLSDNPVTEKGLGYLTCFNKLCELNISDTNVQLDSRLKSFLRNKMSMVFSASPLQTFTHSECRTEGWAEQVINQWETKAAELPQKTLKPRTNALHFYGREKFVRENVHSVCNDAQPEEKTSIIHFHKLDLHSPSERATDSHTHMNTQRGKKRKFSKEQEEHVNSHSAAKRSSSPCPLSAEDLELLSRY